MKRDHNRQERALIRQRHKFLQLRGSKLGVLPGRFSDFLHTPPEQAIIEWVIDNDIKNRRQSTGSLLYNDKKNSKQTTGSLI